MAKGTPDAIVKKVSDAAAEAMNTPALKEKLQSLGANVVPPEQRTPAYLATFLKSEIEKWAAPIKASGVTVD